MSIASDDMSWRTDVVLFQARKRHKIVIWVPQWRNTQGTWPHMSVAIDFAVCVRWHTFEWCDIFCSSLHDRLVRTESKFCLRSKGLFVPVRMLPNSSKIHSDIRVCPPHCLLNKNSSIFQKKTLDVPLEIVNMYLALLKGTSRLSEHRFCWFQVHKISVNILRHAS